MTLIIDGCQYVFGGGSEDARFLKELSIKQVFFPQNKDIKDFVLKLNITKGVSNGREFTYSYGTAYINIFINDPPENGTCTIRIQEENADGKLVWVPAKTGRAILDEFLIQCSDWVDPNDHAINKYIFKLVNKIGETTSKKSLFPLSK